MFELKLRCLGLLYGPEHTLVEVIQDILEGLHVLCLETPANPPRRSQSKMQRKRMSGLL